MGHAKMMEHKTGGSHMKTGFDKKHAASSRKGKRSMKRGMRKGR